MITVSVWVRWLIMVANASRMAVKATAPAARFLPLSNVSITSTISSYLCLASPVFIAVSFLLIYATLPSETSLDYVMRAKSSHRTRWAEGYFNAMRL